MFGKYDSCTCSIPLEPLFLEGSIPPTAYNVVKDQEFRGEIRIGLTFTPKVVFLFIKFNFTVLVELPQDGESIDYMIVTHCDYLPIVPPN